jgi:ABC-type Fe3+/spermidine/putrescine transport system ATPase subunit
MEPILAFRHVSKIYGKRRVVEALSFDVLPGESIALLGPSGSGKTTVLRLIAGLEKPDDGEIWIAGQGVAKAGRNIVPSYERGVGLVFQDLALWPHLTVRGNLAFVVDSTSTSRRAERINEALRMSKVDLGLADRYPHELSGGEQQRVALARALVGASRLLLLDEPFSNVDTELKVVLRTQFASLQKETRQTTICVTHDPDDAAALAERTLLMRDGKIEKVADSSI